MTATGGVHWDEHAETTIEDICLARAISCRLAKDRQDRRCQQGSRDIAKFCVCTLPPTSAVPAKMGSGFRCSTEASARQAWDNTMTELERRGWFARLHIDRPAYPRAASAQLAGITDYVTATGLRARARGPAIVVILLFYFRPLPAPHSANVPIHRFWSVLPMKK